MTESFTHVEKEILQRIKSNKNPLEIASDLFLSVRQIESHINLINEKVNENKSKAPQNDNRRLIPFT